MRAARVARPPGEDLDPLQAGWLSRSQIEHEARAQRSAAMALALRSVARALHDVLRVTAADWRKKRFARATYRALSNLDDHTLRDLGVERSELSSVALELARAGDASRVWTTRVPSRTRT